MSPPASLFVATPCYGGLAHAAYMQGLLALQAACRREGVGLKVTLGGGDALISRARAAMMAQFLASDATHLMFIDADIGFSPEAVMRLLAFGQPIVGGLYARRPRPGLAQPGADYTALEGEQPDGAGFLKVASVGAGFLMITRAAAERMAAAHLQLRARLGDTKDAGATAAVMVFEPIAAHGGRHLAEHEAFHHRWRALGGEVWADTRAGLSHIGSGDHLLP